MAAKRTTSEIVLIGIAVVVVLGATPQLAPAASHGESPPVVGPAADLQPDYNVTFSSTTIGELVLRNVVITDVRVGEVTVDEMTVGNETTEDLELENVTLDRLIVERAVVQDVSTGELSVRNRSVLNVPGGELIGNAGDRSLDRHVIDNLTVSGVEIDQLHLARLTAETDLETIDGEVEEQPDEEPTAEPAVSIGESEAGTANVTNASFERGSVESASVENETVTPDEGNGTDDNEEGEDDTEELDDDSSASVGESARISARIGR